MEISPELLELLQLSEVLDEAIYAISQGPVSAEQFEHPINTNCNHVASIHEVPYNADSRYTQNIIESWKKTIKGKTCKKEKKTLKQELVYLRENKRQLQQQVHELTKRQAGRTISRAAQNNLLWRTRAKSQASKSQESLQENARLRALIQEQVKIKEALQRAFVKHPKLSVSLVVV